MIKQYNEYILYLIVLFVTISGLVYKLQSEYIPPVIDKTITFDVVAHNNKLTVKDCLYKDKISENIHDTEFQTFFDTCVYYSNSLNIPLEWFLSAMKSESDFNSLAKNKAGSGALGLIQFMPFIYNSEEFGNFTKQQFENLGWEKQLFFVYKYLKIRIEKADEKGCKLKTFTDFYMVIFYPDAICADDDYVIAKFPTKRYMQNKGCDVYTTGVKVKYNNGKIIPTPDKILTTGDMRVWLFNKLPIAYNYTLNQ